MSGKRKLITLGKIDKKFLLIFAAIVIRGISELTVEMKFTESSSSNIDNVITIGIYSLGLFLSFPLFIAYRIINRKIKRIMVFYHPLIKIILIMLFRNTINLRLLLKNFCGFY